MVRLIYMERARIRKSDRPKIGFGGADLLGNLLTHWEQGGKNEMKKLAIVMLVLLIGAMIFGCGGRENAINAVKSEKVPYGFSGWKNNKTMGQWANEHNATWKAFESKVLDQKVVIVNVEKEKDGKILTIQFIYFPKLDGDAMFDSFKVSYKGQWIDNKPASDKEVENF